MLRLVLFVFIISASVYGSADRSALFSTLHENHTKTSQSDILFALDFTNQDGANSPLDWFKKKGFTEKFASNLNLGFRDEGILFEATTKRTAVFLKQQNIPGARKIRIRWKVLHYPAGANW